MCVSLLSSIQHVQCGLDGILGIGMMTSFSCCMYTCYLYNTLEYINHDTVCVRVYYRHFAGYDTHKQCMMLLLIVGILLQRKM